jgi:hypothetical protein
VDENSQRKSVNVPGKGGEWGSREGGARNRTIFFRSLLHARLDLWAEQFWVQRHRSLILGRWSGHSSYDG